MAVVAISNAVVHFRFCIFELWYDIPNLLVKFCRDRTKTDGVSTVFRVFNMAAAAFLKLMIDDFQPKLQGECFSRHLQFKFGVNISIFG
jgi:hypothetical protein